jgi:uncharacterized membrane protein HdeD (DUF308 family)
VTTLDAPTTTHLLRRLYLARSAFALVWAVLLVLSTVALDSGSGLSPLTTALVVLYPLVDLAAAVVDRRSASDARPSALLVVNMVLSLATAIGLVVAVMSGTAAVLLVWGLWAITAGLVQLVVALSRRHLGGQWAMILSGGISVLAGTGFVASSHAGGALTGIAGYAVLGGAFFLVSALRLRRTAKVVR